MSGHCRMTILDPQSFAASTLADSEGLIAALRSLESCLAGSDSPLDLIVQDLCSIPNLFEFVVSALPSARQLVSRIIDTYPADPALVEASYTNLLLQRVSSALFALPPDLFSSHTVHQIGQYRVNLEDALLVLASLRSADFAVFTHVIPEVAPQDIEYDEDVSGFSVRSKQKKFKRKNKNRTSTIDAAPYHKLGVNVSSNYAEASEMARQISDNLKMMLKFYLELLLEPSLAQPLRDAYITTRNDSSMRPTAPRKAGLEVVDGKPSAYPKVQPIKAALYFENADKLGEWRIIIGTNGAKKLREFAHGDRETFRIVLKKIEELSNGQFSADNQKRLNGFSGVPIFEAKMQRDLRLVYQIDVLPDRDGNFERQAIRIFGIYTHTQLNRFWDAIGRHLVGNGKEYFRRCVFRNRPIQRRGGDVYLPASFPPESAENDTKPIHLALSDDDKEELHSLLVLEKYVTFSQAFLHSLIVNKTVQYVFELHPQELKIVECSSSCYVLGRSGTGKTTTMLRKMLGIEFAWQMQASGSGMRKPRQIFVTKSRVLAAKVEESFSEQLESLALAGYSLADLKKIPVESTETGLVDIDDVERADIPQKFSLLEDCHFPLFVTFDQLARMIAADVLSSDDAEVQRVAKFFVNTDESEPKDSFVTYDVFARTYWPHFPRPLPKGFEPWLVFSEFIGVIKGSETSLSCPDGFLDEATYCGLSTRCNPTFANHRQAVYALFQSYCKLKKERRHHDAADRTHAILRTLHGGTPLGTHAIPRTLLGGTPLETQRVRFLYVDEAQDNLLIDALLLWLICQNPEGLFWAGDTAQTISAGSSFRFDDLKAFLYRIERDHSLHQIQGRSVADPVMFQLSKNYRSHGGIVDCAHSVIERIMHFWPDAIDSLKPEHGTVPGWKPVFFHSWDQDTVRYEQFLFGESGSRIEFGAQQCILVRDEKAREKLRQEVGEIGLIMTLYDSKGLEFNDVLLYNFFEDSVIDASRWSVLLNDAEGEVDGKDLGKVYAPSFWRDEGRFAGVCSELKSLYVGITRARKNLWIFDKSDKGEPMRMIWTARNQVQNCTPGTDVPHLAVSSTPDEWASFGHDLFRHKRYPQAMHCFARALMPRMEAICEAFHLREVARAKVGVASPKVQEAAFLTAAIAFTKSADDAPPGKDKLQYYRNAAECYIRAGDDRKAATAYLSAEEYELGAKRFRKAGLFDETLEVLHEYRPKISCYEELLDVCRLFYCRKRDGKRPRSLSLFSSFEEEEEFLKDYDLDFARATLLESHGKYMDAAEIHMSENRPLDAIKDLLKERDSRDAVQKATKILLDGLWFGCSFGIAPQTVAADQSIAKLLNLAHKLPLDSVDLLNRQEISMFQAIAQTDLATLNKLAVEFMKGNRKPAALLALDHFFSHLPNLRTYNIHEMSSFLTNFMEYSRLLHSIICHPDPLSIDSIRRLFCIRKESNTEYGLVLGSFLHSSITGDRNGLFYSQYSVIALSKNDIASALRRYLAEHLRERVLQENELCRQAPVLSPCLTFIITDQCKRPNCPQEHVKRDVFNSKRYNLRLGIHLQQINVLQLMFLVNPYPHVRTRAIMLDWLSRLYDALNPQSHVQGSVADLDLSLIPGMNQDAMRIMKYWVRDALYNLHPGRWDFLSTMLRLTSFCFAFDKSSAIACINRAYFNLPRVRIPQMIYPDGDYVVEDIAKFFDGTQYYCISAGLKFMRYILKSSQGVDLSVFCDVLERIIGKISISWRLSFNPPLDGLVLPRAWLSSNEDFSSKKGVWVAFTIAMLDCVQDLLKHLQSEAASLRQLQVSTGGSIRNQEIYTLLNTKLTPILCDVFISRICRALCFLTHNVRNLDIRQKIKGIFKSLQTIGPVQRAYRRYVEARENEFLWTVVGYDNEAKVVIEDLVQLLHKARDRYRVPPLRLPRIKHIYFTDPSEIPSLLSSQLVVTRSELHADAPAFIPPNTIEKAGDDHQARLEESDVEPVDELHEEPEPQELAPAGDEPALIHEHGPAEQDISAAEKIQAAYRKYRRRCEALTRAFGKGLKAQKNIVFVECLRNVYALSWGKTPYRTLYLWALPRLVVCLDRVIAIAHGFKTKTKGLLLEEDHDRLEELGKKTSQINVLLKDGHALRKRIEPNATMHQASNREKATMKEVVLAIKDIIRRLPDQAQDIQDDFNFAYKLVMFEKQQAPKPEKPDLNTEDLSEFDLYY